LDCLVLKIRGIINTTRKLTGSSARKLRRGQANLLPGRIHTFEMGPLVAAELNYQAEALTRNIADSDLTGLTSFARYYGKPHRHIIIDREVWLNFLQSNQTQHPRINPEGVAGPGKKSSR